MGTDSVVPEEVFGEVVLEGRDIGEYGESVVVDELLLYRSVEAFNMTVHTRTSGVRVEVDDVLVFYMFPEVFFKLRAVVCLYVSNSERKYLL